MKKLIILKSMEYDRNIYLSFDRDILTNVNYSQGIDNEDFDYFIPNNFSDDLTEIVNDTFATFRCKILADELQTINILNYIVNATLIREI